jgi:hypothetical protein
MPRQFAVASAGEFAVNQSRRSLIFIDREVQGALMFRATFYWFFCLLTITLMLICWNAYHGPSRRFMDLFADLYYRYAPALAASLLLLPVVLVDVIRLSNRFVGPMVRLKGALQDMADGRPAQPVNFRDNDFWRDLATDFNRAAARVARDSVDRSSATEEMPERASDQVVAKA